MTFFKEVLDKLVSLDRGSLILRNGPLTFGGQNFQTWWKSSFLFSNTNGTASSTLQRKPDTLSHLRLHFDSWRRQDRHLDLLL